MRKKVFIEEGDDETHVQLTPLLDVVFVLLITFMVLAPMLNVDHVELATAGISNKNQPAQSVMSVTLRADNSIWFRGKQVGLQQLESILRAEHQRFPDQSPQLMADKNCHFGAYQDIKNMLEECGFQQLDVILK
ncbi:MAG TPA: biopolymer transporter ExbD [Chlamydiales bacterium]|nr:biopolymer transporter ExbD [Chlamydiales bacterium]